MQHTVRWLVTEDNSGRVDGMFKPRGRVCKGDDGYLRIAPNDGLVSVQETDIQ